jgi:general secretion pathway protein G
MVRRGFTLIELLVVMTVISLLLTIAVPQYFKSVQHSKESVLRENLRTTREAIDRFQGDLGRYPEDLAELVSKRYLRAMPFDPVADSSSTWVLVAPLDTTTAGRVFDLRSSAEGAGADGTAYANW